MEGLKDEIGQLYENQGEGCSMQKSKTEGSEAGLSLPVVLVFERVLKCG